MDVAKISVYLERACVKIRNTSNICSVVSTGEWKMIRQVTINMFDAKKTKDEIVEWIREWFEVNGKDCKAVIGISGGKDSSVVAALCTEALGKDRVYGVLMPPRKTKRCNYGIES